jgi:hypothetical protein
MRGYKAQWWNTRPLSQNGVSITADVTRKRPPVLAASRASSSRRFSFWRLLTYGEIGEFIASIRLPARVKPDIVDAHVALTTRATRSVVWTSDPENIASYQVGTDFIRRI